MKNDEGEHRDNEREEHRDFWIRQLELYYGSLIMYARSLTRKANVGEAEDWVNACACRILKYAPDPAIVGVPTAYLRRMMFNLWADEIRKRKIGSVVSMDTPNNKEALEKSLPCVAPHVEAVLKKSEFREALKALGPFRDDEKELLAWVTEGNTINDFSLAFGEEPKKTKKRWFALINKLKYRWKVKHRQS